jgi:hypothetical protein
MLRSKHVSTAASISQANYNHFEEGGEKGTEKEMYYTALNL